MDTPVNRLYLEKLKRTTLERGWAVSSPATGAFLPPTDAWGFPKYPDRTVILPPDADLGGALEAFIRSNAAFLAETNCWLGIWVNPETKNIYLDITTGCSDLDEALRVTARLNAASRRKIIAVHNSSRDETVYL